MRRGKLPARWGEDDDGRPVLKPAKFLTPVGLVVTDDRVGTPVAQVEQHIGKAEPDACNQNRGDGYQRDRLAGICKPAMKNRPLISAEQSRHPRERRGFTFQQSPLT